jgi:FkbM family methyltransferase
LRSPAQYNFDRLNRSSFINWEWEFSQYGQDWILFVNWLHTRGRTGFYVESGANDPLRVSNTAFYDLCMGWQGLCVEPTTGHHAGLLEFRTCHLEPVCLSYQEETINMLGENPTREEVENSNPVKCERLDTLLLKHNITHVDLWSLDIEGFEMNALRGLRGVPFPDLLLMEQQDMGGDACSQMAIDYRLTALGYDKHRFVSDGIYIRRETGPLQVPNATALNEYVCQLEGPRCDAIGKELFFLSRMNKR